MNPRAILTFLSTIAILGAAQVARADRPARPSRGALTPILPLAFEANRGQTDGRVDYIARGRGYTLFLSADEAVLSLAGPTPLGRPRAPGLLSAAKQPQALRMSAVRFGLVGATRRPAVSAAERQPGEVNYLIGRDPKKWHAHIPSYGRLLYRGVYPGIDLAYYGVEGRLEHDFIVQPGADPRRIALAEEGADSARIDRSGDLVLCTTTGEVRQKRPVIYQEIDGRRKQVSGCFVLHSRRASNSDRRTALHVGFQVAAYDRSRPLVIDPIIIYSTYLSKSGVSFAAISAATAASSTIGHGIAVDADGNAYVAGQTNSLDFPTVNPIQATRAGDAVTGDANSFDAFIMKLSADGTTRLYSTYLGGSAWDSALAIAVDSARHAFVAGATESGDFPTTPGAVQPGWGGRRDVFVARLSADGSTLDYSTYLGGANNETPVGIGVDTAGNAYVGGETYSADFPTTAGSFQPTVPPSSIYGLNENGFVAKLNPSGSTLVYSTYVGGSGIEATGPLLGGFAVDAEGHAFLGGVTLSADFPTTPGAYRTSLDGYLDAFVVKLNVEGTALVYGTLLGIGNADESLPSGLCVDSAGNAYVAGQTLSHDFPTTPGAFQTRFAGPGQGHGFSEFAGFVMKLNPTGSDLVYSTYVAGYGTANIQLFGITADQAGNAYAFGQGGGVGFPTVNPIQRLPNGGEDVLLVRLNPDGSALTFSTFLGGSGDEFGTGATVGSNGVVYVTGVTSSVDFPTTGNSVQRTLTGSTDAFVFAIDPNSGGHSGK